MRHHAMVLMGAAAMLASTAPNAARADDTLLVTGNLGASYAPNDPYENRFTVGGQAGLGVYYSFAPQLAVGGRVDGIILPQDEDHDALIDDGNYGFGSLMAAVRLRPLADPSEAARATGLYVDGAIGPAIVEDDGQLAFAAGIGYSFAAGNLGIGPQVRYTQVLERSRQQFGGLDARIVTAGLEITFLDDRPEPRVAQRSIELGEPQPELAKADEAPEPEREPTLDVIVTGFVDDQLSIDERVFFAFDEAHLRPRGRQVLDLIVEQWREQGGNWAALRVQGHADERGPATYNVDLSRRRAQSVKGYLASQGMPRSLVDIEAYGESRPLIEDATTPREYQMNRRVQFEIVREGQQPTDTRD